MYLKKLVDRYPSLKDSEEDIKNVCSLIAGSFLRGRKLLLCGNGGSAADCEHISGELLKSFIKKRPLSKELKESLENSKTDEGSYLANNLEQAFPAIPLTSFSSLITAFSNDVAPDLVFAQLVNALGKSGDILFCISTSGNAKSVLYAAETAKAKGLPVVGLTGKNGGKLRDFCDIIISVPETETYKIQELHLPVYHAICAQIEHTFSE